MRSIGMMSRRTMLAGAGAATGVLAVPVSARSRSASPAFALRPWMDLASVPGASWAVLSDGGVSAEAEGYAKAGGAAATSDTLFEAASLSKPVLAAAIHSLVADRLLDLDEPVIRHVDFTNDPATRGVTPRHLLSHSSGLPNWRTEPGSALASRFRPGAEFRYSGEGYVLLGRLAEAVTGRTATEVVRDRVLRPAGMTLSTYGWRADQSPAVAWPHDMGGEVMLGKGPALYATRRGKGPMRPVESWTENDRLTAVKAAGDAALPIYMTPNMAAGLWTTAGDYARFLSFAGRLTPMSQPTVIVQNDLSWGLGWGLELSGSSRFAWHWGANDGVANLFVLDLDRGQGLVVLTNGAGGQRVYERAARVRFAREFDALTWLQP